MKTQSDFISRCSKVYPLFKNSYEVVTSQEMDFIEPLPHEQNSFENGKYVPFIVAQDTLLARTQDADPSLFGSFFYDDNLNSPSEAQRALVLPLNNSAQNSATYIFRAGCRGWVGLIAGGNKNQVLIHPYDKNKVKLFATQNVL